MATMVLLDDKGKIHDKLGYGVNINPKLTVPKGWMLSWQHHFMKPTCPIEDTILHHGDSKVLISTVLSTLMARIESPSAKEMSETIELVMQYMGGRIQTFDIHPNSTSFVSGVRNDLHALWQKISAGFKKFRQKIGFGIAV